MKNLLNFPHEIDFLLISGQMWTCSRQPKRLIQQFFVVKSNFNGQKSLLSLEFETFFLPFTEWGFDCAFLVKVLLYSNVIESSVSCNLPQFFVMSDYIAVKTDFGSELV